MNELPPITEEDRQLLHYNPNTDDIVDWVRSYALSAVQMERDKQTARHDEIMVMVAEYGRAEWLDGSHATEDSLEMKEQAFSKVAAAIRSPSKEG